MIVIASHNGEIHLKNLLKDISSFGIPNNKVCVVDNLSDSPSHLNYLKLLKEQEYNILYNPKSTYELGALKYAIENIQDDVWFSMQDSNRIKYNIFSEVTPKLTKNNIYTFLTFQRGIYDSPDDNTFLLMKMGTLYYSKGIFASSIFALDEVIQKTKNDWIIPTSKIESQATERALSIVFDRHNIEICGMGIYDPNKIDKDDGYPHFRKIFGGRGR
jgi:hypothetical protein